jgi:POT family proton-dependent oligopeptide transporter
MKFAIGLWLLGLSFLSMVAGAIEARDDGLAGPQWLLIAYVAVTWGELCLSPVGLSMVTRLAPPRLQSLMMGLWYFSFSISNLLAGLVAAYSIRLASGEWTFVIDGLGGFFLLLTLVPIAVGFGILLMTPWLRRWMHGVH